MSSIKYVVLAVLGICLSNVASEYTEDDLRHMKMMFCGTCKDESVRTDLIHFGKCAVDKHEEVAAKVMGLREQLKNDPDACFGQIIGLLQGYISENPGSEQHALDCFHTNVKKEDLDKCH